MQAGGFMYKRSWRLSVVCGFAAATTILAGTALAHPDDDGVVNDGEAVHGLVHDQHGGAAGHLPATSSNVRLIGKMRVNQDFEGRVADVNVHKGFAYLAAFNQKDCQKGGVYVFDIGDPSTPKQVNFIRAANNSYVGEGVQIISLDTAAFKGDLLIHNNEICFDNLANSGKSGAPAVQGKGGVSLVDVTNPKVHKYVAEGVGDFTNGRATDSPRTSIAHEVHSAFAWQAGSKAYAVLVDDLESSDVDILDITDPRNPVLIKEYDLAADFPQIIQPDLGTAETFFHDVVVKKIGNNWVMLLSYWDGGYVTLNVNDPTNATYIGDTDFADPDPQAPTVNPTARSEGNAHEAEFSLNNNYIVAADEDFNPYSVLIKNLEDNDEYKATQGTHTPQLKPDLNLSGATVFVGRACDADAAVPAATASATIAIAERGLCDFTEKIRNVQEAGGYQGVVVFNREGTDGGCTSGLTMDTSGDQALTLPAVFIPRDKGFALFDKTFDLAACRDASLQQSGIPVGTVGDPINTRAGFDGWGYVHLFRNGTGKLTELDTWALTEAREELNASGKGDLSVHEVAMSERKNDIAYLSHYAGGFRVLRIQNDQLVEVGRFVDEGGNNFWGVQVFLHNGKEYVAASDRDYGLYVFEYTGPGSPNIP
jgi:hypothetical protein